MNKQAEPSTSSSDFPPGFGFWKRTRLRLVSIWYRVSVAWRLTILGVMSALMIAFPTTVYMIEAQKAISTARNEILGVPVIRTLFNAMKAIQDHRGLTIAALAGNRGIDAPARQAASEADKAIAQAQELLNQSGRGDSLGLPLQALGNDWKELREEVAKGGADISAVFSSHAALISKLAELVVRAGDDYEQMLDPDLVSLHQVMLAVMTTPTFIDYLGELRDRGTAVLHSKQISEAERRRLAGQAAAAKTILQRGNYSAERATAGKDASSERLGNTYAEASSSAASALALVQKLTNSATLEGDADDFYKRMTTAINAQYALVDMAELALGEVVSARERQLLWTRNLLAAAILLLGLLYTLVGVMISLSISGPFKSALEVCENIANGFIGQTIGVRGTDEMARLRLTMRTLQEALSRFIEELNLLSQRQAEGVLSHRMPAEEFSGAFKVAAEQMNKLVDDQNSEMMQNFGLVADYAKGDFSKDAPVLPGEKKAITDSVAQVKFNLSSINQEIQQLVSAASSGDFAQRGNSSAYTNEFKNMVDGLNQLMQAADTGLSEVGRTLNRIANADLSQKMTGEFQGKFAELQSDANRTIDQLIEIVARIREASETINAGSTEIANGNSDLSSRTEQQASSLEETASSMEQLTATVKHNSENAQQANQQADAASAVATKGGEMIRQVVVTMGGISESSKKITDITGVIDSIAFQTNILALNAAVEAARAGEQGRGFAVVASEVRNLAHRSASAAKEIKALIADSQEKVGSGARLVDVAGVTMEEIVTTVKRVSDIVSEISEASREQSSGIEQVNQAITHMDEATQQNAALVEQAAAAAESLQEQANNLVETVSVFRLESDQPVKGAERVERRGPDRAVNVSRLPAKASPKPANMSARSASATSVPANPPTRSATRGESTSSGKSESRPQMAKKVANSDEDWLEF